MEKINQKYKKYGVGEALPNILNKLQFHQKNTSC